MCYKYLAKLKSKISLFLCYNTVKIMILSRYRYRFQVMVTHRSPPLPQGRWETVRGR